MKRTSGIIMMLFIAGAAIGVAAYSWGGRAGQTPSDVPKAAAPAPPPHPVPATVNKAVYTAKMLAIANRQPPTHCTPAKAHSLAPAAPAADPQADGADAAPQSPALMARNTKNKKKTILPPCPKPRWPVHAAIPDAGALLPFKRIVAYYGNFYSKRMGILGEYPPAQVLSRLKSQAAAWAAADPSTPVVQAVDYIAVSAQGMPGRDGQYRMRMPQSQIEKAIGLANQIHGLAFLDVQPGWSSVETEVPLLASYLKQPNVELALDPEFALVEGKKPGAWIGTMSAKDINYAARYLARIVQQNHLPPKILVVHRFTQRMVTDFSAIKPLPQVQIVMDMDGFGSPVLKTSTYKDFIARQPVQFTGFKLFYKNDVKIGGHLMTPAQVLRLAPQPSFILYQ